MKLFFLLIFSFSLHAFPLDRVILGCDDNPDYLEFWPIIAPVWTAMGIKPTLAVIGESGEIEVDESLGDIIYFPPVPELPTSLQAQVIRLFLPALFPDEFCIISDMDMIPISKGYFWGGASVCSKDSFLVYRDMTHPDMNRYPMCYLAGRGDVFGDIFAVNSFEDMRDLIINWEAKGLGWNTDELVAFQYLNQWEEAGGKVTKLGHSVGPRIDRGDWWIGSCDTLDLKDFIDCHCPRPYSAHKEAIDRIIFAINDRLELVSFRGSK